jgi:DNA-binding SARP family transcriptional activator
MTQIKVRLLGAPRIDRAGVPVPLATRKCVALLANLALAGAPVRRERLMALLWPEMDQTRAQGDLRRALTTLRQALGDDALESTRQTIQLNQDQIWVDVSQFRALAGRPIDSSTPTARDRASVVDSERIAQLEEAVAFWRDDFMAGFSLRDSAEFDDWQAREGERLRNELATALQALTRLHDESGNPASAIAHARRWLALDPLREDAHRALMRLYAQSGRRSDALQQYQACERVLAGELGVQPLQETTDLYHAIKDNQPSKSRSAGLSSQAQPEPLPRPALAFNNLPLVGREHEWAGMVGAQKTWRTRGYWIAIEGEPGIGKTRLLDDFAAHAAAMRNHVQQLGAKSYQSQFENAPDYVVMFVPGEHFVAAHFGHH